MLLGVPLESRGACRAFLAAGHGAIGRRRAVNEKGANSRKLAEAYFEVSSYQALITC